MIHPQRYHVNSFASPLEKKHLISTTEEPADHSTKQIKIHEKFIVTFSQSMLFDFYDSKSMKIFLSCIREHLYLENKAMNVTHSLS
jgi:hypothetical protein